MNDVKIGFQLEIEEDGFPPVSVETLNGRLISETTVELDNTPFFAEGVAAGDILRFNKIRDSEILEYEHVVQASGNKSISIILIDEECKENIYQKLKGFGCYCEYGDFTDFAMIAACVGADCDYSLIAEFLDQQEGSGKLSYAELCV